MATKDTRASRFPLERVTESQLQRLGEVLWSWSLCEDCHNAHGCKTESCPSRRSKRLSRYFEYYKILTALYEPDVRPGEHAALNKHEDLLNIIQQLKLQPDMTQAQLACKIFENQPGRGSPPLADQDRAISLAVKIMTMVDCSAEHQSSALLEHGVSQIPWRSNVTFSQFILDVFLMTDYPSLNSDEFSMSSETKTAITANKLKKRTGLKYQPTNDLRRHLKLDRKNNILEIFHHTAFLKEHLRLTKDRPRSLSVRDSLSL